MAPDRRWRGSATAAVLLDAAAVAVYLAVIDAQGGEAVTDGAIVAWALAMSLPGLLSAVALATTPRVAPWLLGAAAIAAAGLGLLAILSVGVLLLAVAAVSGTAALVSGASVSARDGVPHNSQA